MDSPWIIGPLVLFCAWRADVNYHEGNAITGAFFFALALLNLFSFATEIFS